MEKFNEIINTSYDVLDEGKKEFIKTHEKILFYGKNACENLYQMAKQLEYMKNTQLYLNAGFETFEDYTEGVLGLKRSQVYNYIKVANAYSDQFLIANSNLGITKLLVLAELEEPVVEKVIETVEVEDKSVSDLKALVDSLTKEKKDLEKENKKVSKDLKTQIKELKDELKQAKEDLKNKSEGERLSIDDISNEKNDVVESVNEKRISELEIDLTNKLGRIDDLEKLLKEKETLLEEFKTNQKVNTINSNPELIKFKVKFEELQLNIKSLKDIINVLDDDSKSKCINAFNTVLRGALYE